MKRILIAALLMVFALAGCAVTAAPQTPDQLQANLVRQVQKACQIAQPTIASLQSMPDLQLTVEQQADLVNASVLAGRVCTMDLTPVPQTVAEFVQAAFPAVIKIVNASPLMPQDKAAATIALTAAQIAVSVALAQ